MTKRWLIIVFGAICLSMALVLFILRLGMRQDVPQQSTSRFIKSYRNVNIPYSNFPKARNPPPATVHKLHLHVRYRMIVVSNSDDPDDPNEDTISVNNQGNIALTLKRKGYTWRKKHFWQLRSVGYTAVNALNDLGQVVGGTYKVIDGAILGYPGDAILWNDGHTVTLGSICGFTDSIAVAINNTGEVVGTSGPASPGEDSYGDANPDQNALDHVFLWKRGHMTDLGKGEVAAINDAGQIAGTLPPPLPPGDDETNGHHAAVWEHGQWHSLASCHGWVYVQATGINNEGGVCGYGSTRTAGCRAKRSCGAITQ
jgi:uncharacterized membrane protein